MLKARTLPPPRRMVSAAGNRLGRIPRLRDAGAAAFSRTIREQWGAGDESGLYPEASLVFREEDQPAEAQAAADLHLTQFTLRLLIQLSETVNLTRTSAVTMELHSLQRSVASCLTALETRNRESCRELRTLLVRLSAASPQEKPGNRSAAEEVRTVRETARRWLTELSAPRAALPVSSFPEIPAGLTERRNAAPQATPGRDKNAAPQATPGRGENTAQRAPVPSDGVPAGTDERRFSPVGPALPQPHTYGFPRSRPLWRTLTAAGDLTAYSHFQEPAISRSRALDTVRNRFVQLISAAPRTERELVWQAAERELIHFSSAAGSMAAHTPETLAQGLRGGTNEEFIRLLRTVEQRLQSPEPLRELPAAAARREELAQTAAPALTLLAGALAVRPLDRGGLLASLRSCPEPVRRAFLRLSEESGAFAENPQLQRAAMSAGTQLSRLTRESTVRELKRLERWTRELGTAVPKAETASVLRTFFREIHREERLTAQLAAVPGPERQLLLRELLWERNGSERRGSWEQPGLADARRLVYLLETCSESEQQAVLRAAGTGRKNLRAAEGLPELFRREIRQHALPEMVPWGPRREIRRSETGAPGGSVSPAGRLLPRQIRKSGAPETPLLLLSPPLNGRESGETGVPVPPADVTMEFSAPRAGGWRERQERFIQKLQERTEELLEPSVFRTGTPSGLPSDRSRGGETTPDAAYSGGGVSLRYLQSENRNSRPAAGESRVFSGSPETSFAEKTSSGAARARAETLRGTVLRAAEKQRLSGLAPEPGIPPRSPSGPAAGKPREAVYPEQSEVLRLSGLRGGSEETARRSESEITVTFPAARRGAAPLRQTGGPAALLARMENRLALPAADRPVSLKRGGAGSAKKSAVSRKSGNGAPGTMSDEERPGEGHLIQYGAGRPQIGWEQGPGNEFPTLQSGFAPQGTGFLQDRLARKPLPALDRTASGGTAPGASGANTALGRQAASAAPGRQAANTAPGRQAANAAVLRVPAKMGLRMERTNQFPAVADFPVFANAALRTPALRAAALRTLQTDRTPALRVPQTGRTPAAPAGLRQAQHPFYREAELELRQRNTAAARQESMPVVGGELPHTREIRQLHRQAQEQQQTITGQREDIGNLKAQMERQEALVKSAMSRAAVPPSENPGEVRRLAKAVMKEMEGQLRLERQRRGMT